MSGEIWDLVMSGAYWVFLGGSNPDSEGEGPWQGGGGVVTIGWRVLGLQS